MGPKPGQQALSAREAEASADAAARRARRRARLRPLGVTAVIVVAATVATAHPAPALHGRGAGVLAALIAYGAAMLLAMRGDPQRVPAPATVAMVVVLAASGLALVALQPHGPTELAPSAAVFAAVARLPRRWGLEAAGALMLGLAVALALSPGTGAQGIAAALLLCALLASMAEFMARAAESQDRAELLYAQLQDARDAQAAAAATEERSRIAAELHDVLAHSLSGAAIQLQGARKLIERDPGDPRLAQAVARAGELVRGGLDDARRAVRALHGDELPAIEQLPALLESFRRDQLTEVRFTELGAPRQLATDASLALYRGAQEALTNIARYAPGASVEVTLRHDETSTTLTIEDRRPADLAASDGDSGTSAGGAGLAGVGGGFGLSGMRERVQRIGGEMDAGSTGVGWRVRLVVPG